MDKIKIVTACGVGMGSSLILKMMVEDILKAEGIDAKVENIDIGSIKSANADMVVVQSFHEDKVKDAAKVVVNIDNFLDKEKLKNKVLEGIRVLQNKD
ncbi:PTS sugar transporter subunit IIB [Thermovenabulum gondwanense]|uniref:Ascorbate-specific phosphotransferase enzyme IIB component n=1 Tax=Thermovenabulum gondwanense TaxID=520767 RepID=A0A162MTS9_9FIRM|nr:PTS sugar transporter subunit IIB [Thermovenabulum gondwanense]KYO67317.1 Ascorbate-specific phosphotransferase enzyme IIB component [Thermovenabulum gondwanense]